MLGTFSLGVMVGMQWVKEKVIKELNSDEFRNKLNTSLEEAFVQAEAEYSQANPPKTTFQEKLRQRMREAKNKQNGNN